MLCYVRCPPGSGSQYLGRICSVDVPRGCRSVDAYKSIGRHSVNINIKVARKVTTMAHHSAVAAALSRGKTLTKRQ
jgi:hypothetical protein